MFAFLGVTAECARDRERTSAAFFDARQFDVAQKAGPARFPNEFELDRIERYVGMNRSRIGEDVGHFEVSDHIDHAAFAFDLDSRTLGNVNCQIYAILGRPFTHCYFTAGNANIARFDSST